MALRDWRWPQWLIVIGIVLLLLLGAVVAYVLLRPEVFAPPPAPPEVVIPPELPAPIPGAPELPPAEVPARVPLSQIQGTDLESPIDEVARGDITRVETLVQTPVEHVSLGPSGNNINYYEPSTRKFYRIDSEGNVEKISDTVFAEVENVVFADNGNDAVIEFPDGSNVLYNFETDEQVTLPDHWEDFDFSPDSNSIAFKSLAFDPEERWLAVSDKTGSTARRIALLGNNEDIVDVDWSPNNQVVATYTRPDGLSRSELYFVGFNQENFPLSKVQGINFEGKWTPSGKELLYSTAHQTNDFKPALWLVDGSGTALGQNRRQINLQTWPHKCAFLGDSKAYCGVPRNLPEGAGIIPAVADNIPDNIYEINLDTGATTRLAIPEEILNVESLSVTDDGSQLFIHDRLTGSVRKIRLE